MPKNINSLLYITVIHIKPPTPASIHKERPLHLYFNMELKYIIGKIHYKVFKERKDTRIKELLSGREFLQAASQEMFRRAKSAPQGSKG